jgi:hypothetical protein
MNRDHDFDLAVFSSASRVYWQGRLVLATYMIDRNGEYYAVVYEDGSCQTITRDERQYLMQGRRVGAE